MISVPISNEDLTTLEKERYTHPHPSLSPIFIVRIACLVDRKKFRNAKDVIGSVNAVIVGTNVGSWPGSIPAGTPILSLTTTTNSAGAAPLFLNRSS